MDVKQEIANQVEKLPPAMQEQVLRFAAFLAATTQVGEHGSALLHSLVPSLDPRLGPGDDRSHRSGM